jgi:hypothetical protein
MLLDAAKHGNVPVITLLLEKQTIPIDHMNKKGETALIRAAWKGELAALLLLLEKGASPSIINSNGCTALIMACKCNNRSCVRALIEFGGSPIDCVDENGLTALAYLALWAPQPPNNSNSSQNQNETEPYWEGMELLLQLNARIDIPPNVANLLLCRAANTSQVSRRRGLGWGRKKKINCIVK